MQTVLILGGYGVFGSRLAERLAATDQVRVIVAGRNLEKAKAFAAEHDCLAAELDVQAPDLEPAFARYQPHIIIDAAGPFQSYGDTPYRVAEAAIRLGAHYLDLSDDAAFTHGISALDEAAKQAGVCVLSGASSVPAISSVVAANLVAELSDVHSIDSVILPGNRAPRGPSVMRSILSQVGRPLRLWRGNRWVERPAWSDLKRYDLHVPGTRSVTGRRASLIGAPDLDLFPKLFQARSVTFRAGLELPIMQYSLWLLHWLPRLKGLRSLLPFTGVLKWLADRMERWGSDRGGMQVNVRGRSESGALVERCWTLIVEQGDGPYIPGVASLVLASKLRAATIDPGARPCINSFSMTDLETGFAGLNIEADESERVIVPVFQTVLGADYHALPAALQDLHNIAATRLWTGQAEVRRGKGWLSQIMGAVAGFPPARAKVPVEVEMIRTAKGETWIRRFGRYQFRSFLSSGQRRGEPVLLERFGALSFAIDLQGRDDRLHFPVRGGRLLGLPLPRLVLPQSETREYVDAEGRACFDVRISTPFGGLIAHYQGWLIEAAAP